MKGWISKLAQSVVQQFTSVKGVGVGSPRDHNYWQVLIIILVFTSCTLLLYFFIYL